MGSSWSDVNFIGCVSVEGRGLLAEVTELEKGRQILATSAIESLSGDLKEFLIGGGNLTGGDVQVAGGMLGSLISWIKSGMLYLNDSELKVSVTELIGIASQLLSSDLVEEWQVEVEAARFSSADFLFSLEELSRVVSSLGMANTYSQPNIRIQKELWHPEGAATSRPVFLELQQKVLVIVNATRQGNVAPPSDYVLTLLPTLGRLLPHRADFNVSHLVPATPILSVQARDGSGSEVTDVSVTMTLEYSMEVPPHVNTNNYIICVSWRYQGR